MEILIFFTVVFAVILFIIWQFKVIMKYSFNYDKVEVDNKNRLITINDEKISFKDINFVTVEELEQPSVAEKTLTRSGFYSYMSNMVIYLKDGNIKKCKFNYKGALYKILTKLKPYIKIDADIEQYKPNSLAMLLIFIIVIVIIVLT